MTPERIAEIEAALGDGSKLAHATPAIDESCRHYWVPGPDGQPSHCTQCGLSFTRFIFCCMP